MKQENSGQTAVCPYRKKCGGCDYQDVSYAQQLAFKQRYLDRLLGGFAPVKPILGMDDPYHYRCKVHAVYGYSRRTGAISGTYRKNTHNVVSIDRCLIDNELADEIIGTITGMLKSFRIKVYDEDTGYGFLRHVMVRVGHNTGEVMVILVAADPVFPSKNNFVKALLRKYPQITTVVLNINNADTSMVLGPRNIVLYGKGYIVDQVCGCSFAISPASFYKVNPVQTEHLYRCALDFAGLTGGETVIDAYCGIGTMGILAAPHAKSVIGVELNKDAVRSAIGNARHNHVSNIRFYHADATKFMQQMQQGGEKADVIIMDPPRSGSTPEFIQAATALSPSRIVYVSCGPESLERDLRLFGKRKYHAVKIQPVDMFPFTKHVETVVLMSRKDT